MPTDAEKELRSIRAYIPELLELCEEEVLIAHNHGASFRLPELASAIPILKDYAKLSANIGENEDSFLLRFIWEKIGAPLHELFGRHKAYREQPSPSQEQRVALVNYAYGCFADVFYSLALAHASLDAGSIAEIPESRRKWEQVAERVGKIDTDARIALRTAHDAARQSGIVANLDAFAEAAKEHASSARWWAAGVLACAVLLLTGGFVKVFGLEGEPPNNGAWNLAPNLYFFGKRIFLASVVSFLMVTCVRNYRSARHNEVLNEHRKRSLQTFERLRAGAIDEKVKDAILVQATEAIFSMQVSGFADGAVGVTHAHELLELVKDKSKEKN